MCSTNNILCYLILKLTAVCEESWYHLDILLRGTLFNNQHQCYRYWYSEIFQVHVKKSSVIFAWGYSFFASWAPIAVVLLFFWCRSNWSCYVDQNILQGHLNKSIVDTDLFSFKCAFFLLSVPQHRLWLILYLLLQPNTTGTTHHDNNTTSDNSSNINICT